MIYDLFWLVFLIASLLWVASGAAIAGRFPRKWMRGWFEALVTLPVIFILGRSVGLAGAMVFTDTPQYRWIAAPIAMFLAFWVGNVLIWYRGRQKKTAPMPASASWPRLPLILSCLIASMLAYLILLDIDMNARSRLAQIDQRLAFEYFAAEPALVTDSQNAAPLYEKAFARLRNDLGKDVTNPPLGDAENFNANEPATIAFLKRHGQTLALLRQAVELPVCRFKEDSDKPYLARMKAMTDSLDFERQCAVVLSLDAREQIAHGNAGVAIDDVNAIFKMARQFSQRPMMMSALIGIGLDALGDETLEEILPFVKNQADLSKLRFDQLPSLPQLFQNSLRSEERFGLSGLTFFPGIKDSWNNGNNSERVPAYVTPTTIVFRALWIDPDSYVEVMDDLQKASMQPYYLIKDKLPGRDEKRLGLLTSILMAGEDRSLQTNATGIANGTCAQTAVAMTRYRLDHGKLPTQLSALTPDYLDSVPTDPFDGRSLRLTIRNNNWIIHSVGPNGIDDNGVGYDKTHKTKDDVAFTLKATPASATTKQ